MWTTEGDEDEEYLLSELLEQNDGARRRWRAAEAEEAGEGD